jgi:hypothetical protein
MPNQNPLKPFPAWRLPNGTINASDIELEKSIESCERWAWFGGGLVIVGVAAEVAIAAIHPPYDSFLEQWGSSLANSLVAIGVAFEIIFSRMAGLRQNELKRRSDERVAAANARAEEANQKAQEAALELAKLTTPRAISAEHASAITDAISPFAGTPFILLIQPEPEPLSLMNQICDALVAAGWNWLGSGHLIAFNRPGKPSVGMMTGSGILLQLASSKKDAWEAPILALANALVATGLEGVQATEVDDGSVPDTAIHIRIGRKP